MYSFLLWTSICFVLFQRWKQNVFFQKKNNVTVSITDSFNVRPRFFVIPHDLEPHEVVHILTL